MRVSRKHPKWLNRNRKNIFWSLACLLLLVTSFYIYLINTAALNGVRWKNGEGEIASLGADVSELESYYLSLKQSVTLRMAYAKGFEDVKAITFIPAQKIGAAVSANEI
ncbi:MAG: hypothetical protein AAB891_00205 [Patescibacteria group bacterium]